MRAAAVEAVAWRRPSTSIPAVALHNVSCTFPARGRSGGLYTAVKDTTILIEPGEFVSVVGPTGCGKSTLLNVASGLMQPTTGRIEIFGEPLQGINRQAGYMFQADALMPWRSALENVLAGLEYSTERHTSALQSLMSISYAV